MAGSEAGSGGQIVELAPAKVNLSLVVRGRRLDGYHELVSLVAFAVDVFDTVTLNPGSISATETSGADLGTDGAVALAADNIVDRAVRSVAAALPGARAGRFTIEKRIPLAAGLGGGSADAAAALRALAVLNGIDDPAQAFQEIATRLGADVPVCIGDPLPRAAVMAGIGACVWRPPQGVTLLPPNLTAVLVNPRHEVPTGSVFRELGAPLLEQEVEIAPEALAQRGYTDAEALVAALRDAPNDLEAPARRLVPIISDVLAAIEALPACLLSRMSGSGATCFGLFDSPAGAERAAQLLASRHPNWWVRPSRLL